MISDTYQTVRPQYELADIFNLYWDEYKENKKIPSQIHKIVNNIRLCRTAKLGSHKISCSHKNCSHEEISYNSCRDRHCPKCQGSKQIAWVDKRLNELFPVPYFHTVFTLPHSLNTLTLFNQRFIYDLFFDATSYALNQFAMDDKYLGGQLGFFGILHTWGQNLSYHVHIHYIVSGCGLLKQSRSVKRLPYQEKFLFPVKAMSKTVRCYFIKRLKRAYYDEKLNLPGELQRFGDIEEFERFCIALGKESWVCYAKPPFTGPEKVISYIGRYTNRVAISNRRIKSIDNHKIIFSYKDYKEDCKRKDIHFTAHTFIQRLFYHYLPYGFRRIRHYGFLCGSDRKTNLEIIKSFFEKLGKIKLEMIQGIKEWRERFKGCLERICPVCKTGTLLFEFSYDGW